MDPVPGWVPSRSHLLRLIQTPKHHLADPALAARLLGMDEGALLAGATGPATPRDGTLPGQLFESLVMLSARVYARAAEARVRHLRTDKGRHEIDIIVERSDRRVLAVEVKLRGHRRRREAPALVAGAPGCGCVRCHGRYDRSTGFRRERWHCCRTGCASGSLSAVRGRLPLSIAISYSRERYCGSQ